MEREYTDVDGAEYPMDELEFLMKRWKLEYYEDVLKKALRLSYEKELGLDKL